MASSGLTVLWFVLIVALIPISLWVLKRSGLASGAVGATAALIKPVSTLNIGPGQRLVTVEVGTGEAKTWLVLGVTASQINALHTLPAQTVPEAPVAATPNFAAILRRSVGINKDAP